MGSYADFIDSSRICKGVLSIDRCTFLVFCPSLSLWGENSELHRKKAERFSEMVNKVLSSELDPDFVQGKSSELFLYHYRTSSGVDIQFAPFMPKRKKVFSSDSSDPEATTISYYANDYALRVEYNPNKCGLESIYPLLKNIPLSGSFGCGVRLSRLDVAIDYACDINPALCISSGFRKSFIALGNSGIETVYFGSRNSNYYFRLYNKALELREKQHLSFNSSLWRFELEYKKPFSLGSKPEIADILRRFSFYSSGRDTSDWRFNLLLAYAKDHGINSALALLPSATAKRYKRMFADYDQLTIESPFDCYERCFSSVYQKLVSDIVNILTYKG